MHMVSNYEISYMVNLFIFFEQLTKLYHEQDQALKGLEIELASIFRNQVIAIRMPRLMVYLHSGLTGFPD